jgi:class 3 adenylate cyclase/tetratricopeptide (TPR) repeat protein
VAAAHSLGRYIPRIATGWDRDAPGARWQAREVTLCFADISGFTALSERLARRGRVGAEQLTDILDAIFGTMLELAWQRGGALLKFGGDSLLLAFAGSDHVRQAVDTAIECRAALRAAVTGTSAGGEGLRMSVGLHTGTVFFLRVGRSHQELIVCGPASSRTVRLESEAGAGEIVVSDEVADHLPPDAVGAARRPGLLLRWRRARTVPSGRPSSRAPLDAGAAAAWVPVGLREHLRPAPSEPEHRLATVGFVGFDDVDELLSAKGPDAAASAVDEVVTTAQAAADSEAVTFLASDVADGGGKLILVAGAPDTHDDDEGRMLRVARRVAEAECRLPLRIGVHRGHLFAGEVGIAARATYSVLGDTVNVAARLMAAAPPGGVLASPAVVDRSRTLFATTPIAPLRAKGKAQPLHVMAVGDETGTRAPGSSRDLPFVGRTTELAALESAVSGVRAGEGSVVRVSGAPGSGKSRLVTEALEHARELPSLTVRGEPYARDRAYRALREALRELLEIEQGDPQRMALALRDAVNALDPSALPWIPLLADVLQLEVESTPEVQELEPRFRPARLADIVVELLARRLAAPAIIVIEDVHWLDDATAAVIKKVTGVAKTRGWLVIEVGRTNAAAFSPADATITLTPLSSADAENVIDVVTQAAPLHAHETDVIVRRAGGNPLFLGELLQALGARGSVEALPESLEAVVNAEIDALPALARRVLRYASVLGSRFTVGDLEALLADDRVIPDEATRQALEGFIEPDGPDHARFRHTLLRDVAYEGLSYRRRRALHLRAARLLEAEARDPDTVADLLSLHYAMGHDHERAWRFACVAGQQALGSYANVEAAAHFRRAVDAARQAAVADDHLVDVLGLLGDAYEHAGNFPASLDAYRRACRHAGAGITKAGLWLKCARARERSGQFTVALRDLRAAERAIATDAREEAAALRARIDSFRALVRQAQERPREAMAIAEQAARAAESAGDRLALARSLTVLDWARQVIGDPARGSTLLRARLLYEEIGDLEGQGNVTGEIGTNYYWDGLWDDAIASYERAAALFSRCGNPVQEAIAHTNIGEVLVNQQRLDEAEPMLRSACRVLRAAGFVDGATFGEVQLGRLLTGRGDPDAAEALLRPAYEELVELKQMHSALHAAAHLADCLIALKRPDDALALLDEVEAHVDSESSVFAPQASAARIRALLAIGATTDAEAAWRAGMATTGARTQRYDFALLLVLGGEVARRLGRDPDPELVAEGRAILAGLGVRG